MPLRKSVDNQIFVHTVESESEGRYSSGILVREFVDMSQHKMQSESQSIYGGYERQDYEYLPLQRVQKGSDELKSAVDRVSLASMGTNGLTVNSLATVLQFTNKRITTIENLERTDKLRSLYLTHNLIEEISGLSTLVFLRDLDLRHNKIQKMQGLSKLRSLTHLYLDDNKIEAIEGLDGLVFLKVLSLNKNKIKCIEEL